MKNSSVVELFIFIVFVGFVGFMMNSEMELENNNLLTNGEKNNFERTVEWENRLNRMSFVGTVVHDSDPETNSFEIILTANFKDANNDKLSYFWEHLKSWDNVDNRSRIDNSISFKPDNTSNKVECNVGAGVHEFQVTVTDTYNEKSTEIITVSIGNEENIGPNGSISVVKRIPGCMDDKAINYNVQANSDDDTCEYPPPPPPKDPFDGDVDKIREFQTKNGLEADGKWGPSSQKKYEEVQKKSSEKE